METTDVQKRELGEETQHKVRFITFIITMFARAYKMNKQQAYIYLKQYGGLDYLFRHWWTLHTEDPYWSAERRRYCCFYSLTRYGDTAWTDKGIEHPCAFVFISLIVRTL